MGLTYYFHHNPNRHSIHKIYIQRFHWSLTSIAVLNSPSGLVVIVGKEYHFDDNFCPLKRYVVIEETGKPNQTKPRAPDKILTASHEQLMRHE